MNSLILRTAARYLITLLLLFSIFLLLRGHNDPGGGFVGGLVAASALLLYVFSDGVQAARQALLAEPHLYIAGGLLIALLSGALPLASGKPFLTALWADLALPAGIVLELGTPIFFDLGVYMTVLGVTLLIMLTLQEEE